MDFDKDNINQLSDNLRHPIGRIIDPTPGVAAGATIPDLPFFCCKFSKASHHCMLHNDVLQFYWETPDTREHSLEPNYEEIFRTVEIIIELLGWVVTQVT